MNNQSEKTEGWEPCPFCGSTNIKNDRCTARTRCGNCYASGPLISRFMKDGRTQEEASRLAWNTRGRPNP